MVWLNAAVVKLAPVPRRLPPGASYQLKTPPAPVAVSVAVCPTHTVAPVPTGAAGLGLTTTVTAVGVLADTFGAWGTAIWDGLLKPIGETFGDWGTKIWNGFLKPVGETFGDWGTKIWNGFIKPIGDSFSKFGTAIIDSFKNGLPEILKSATTLFTGLADTFKKLFKFDFSGLKTAITEAFNSGSAAIKDGFKSVINPIIDVFNGLIDALNAMQIPELKWAINAGRIGSWSGTLIPAVDLLPNIDPIKKFAQGGLVTGPMGTDAVPSLLTAGEFVINKRAANGIGLSNLIAMNSGKPVGNTTQNITLNLSLNSKEKLDENFVRQRLMPAIREELKRGSLDGRAIVYAGGVRS